MENMASDSPSPSQMGGGGSGSGERRGQGRAPRSKRKRDAISMEHNAYQAPSESSVTSPVLRRSARRRNVSSRKRLALAHAESPSSSLSLDMSESDEDSSQPSPDPQAETQADNIEEIEDENEDLEDDDEEDDEDDEQHTEERLREPEVIVEEGHPAIDLFNCFICNEKLERASATSLALHLRTRHRPASYQSRREGLLAVEVGLCATGGEAWSLTRSGEVRKHNCRPRNREDRGVEALEGEGGGALGLGTRQVSSRIFRGRQACLYLRSLCPTRSHSRRAESSRSSRPSVNLSLQS
jgi:hypothetical protein